MLKQTQKRVAIYCIKEKIYAHNLYFIQKLRKYVETLYIVVPNNLEQKQLKTVKKYGTVIVSDTSDTLATYQHILTEEHTRINRYQQIILCDSCIFGPLSSLNPIFQKINNNKEDIYVLEKRQEGLVSSSFMVLKRAEDINSIKPIKASNYWVQVQDLTISCFSPIQEQDGFYFLELQDNLIKRYQPFIQEGFFTQTPDLWLAHSGGRQVEAVLDYLKKETDYDPGMILEALVHKYPMSMLRENLHLNYILPDDSTPVKTSPSSVALVLYIYYRDLIEDCRRYALSMPKNADIYIITCNADMTKVCEQAFAHFPCHRVYLRQMENRGRDVAAYLVAARDVFEKYDYVCCMHDKKSPQYTKAVGEDFAYHLFECNLATPEYVQNIIQTFDKNPYLGMLVPPCVNFGRINTVGNSIASEEKGVREWIRRLHLGVPFDFDVVAPLGTMFWVRGKSFAPMFNYNWQHADFPPEPNKSTGTILHVLERTYPFAVQAAGYYVGFVLPLAYSRIYLDTTYWLYKERQQQFYGLNNKKSPKPETRIQQVVVPSPSIIHFKDIKRIFKEYIRHKFNKKRQEKRKKPVCSGNVWARYIGLDKGRIIFHLLSGTDQIFLKCGIYRYYPKQDVSLSIQQLQEYYNNYRTKGLFFEIPLDKVKNHPISVHKSENEYFILKWGIPTFSYGCFDFKKEGLFVRIHRRCLYVEDTFHFYKSVLFSLQYSLKKKLIFGLLKLNPIHKYVLFSENGGAGDNAFELFKYAVQHNPNCYFLASQKVIDDIPDSDLKKHMVVFNSWRHVWLFLCSSKWITSYSLTLELLPQKKFLRDILMYAIPGEWVFVPHGITCDKVSIMVHKYSWGNPSTTYCSSESEKTYFMEKYGFRNVSVLGDPRMDKWYEAKLDSNKILVFFTWRFAMRTAKDKNILRSLYLLHIIQVIKVFRHQFPKRHLYYVFHHEVVRAGVDQIIREELGDKGITYIYLNSVEGIREFNTQFKSAKYLITDYSSVAYDFAYKEGAIPIYYLDKDFISGHYPLEQRFFEIHLGVLTYTLKELEKALKLNAPTDEMKKRKKLFFKYQDNKNCERVYNAIFQEEKK